MDVGYGGGSGRRECRGPDPKGLWQAGSPVWTNKESETQKGYLLDSLKITQLLGKRSEFCSPLRLCGELATAPSAPHTSPFPVRPRCPGLEDVSVQEFRDPEGDGARRSAPRWR